MRAIAIAAVACAACTSGHVAYVGPFAQLHVIGGTTPMTFTAAARAAGDTIELFVGCESSTGVSASGLTTTSWQFSGGSPPASSGLLSATVYVGIAADTKPIDITPSWTGPCDRQIAIGDEFAGVYSSGTTSIATGSCTTMVDPMERDAVWAACYPNGGVVAPGADFTKGADDNFGDWTEYAIAQAPPGQVTFDVAGATAAIVAANVLRSR